MMIIYVQFPRGALMNTASSFEIFKLATLLKERELKDYNPTRVYVCSAVVPYFFSHGTETVGHVQDQFIEETISSISRYEYSVRSIISFQEQ